MRDSLRRILWIVPTMVFISIIAFWAVAAASTKNEHSLPMFLNLEPQTGRELALAAATSIAKEDLDAAESRVLLARLGGAALPHVLPNFDALDPASRSRVALALAPIARRMGVGAEHELVDPNLAVVFWTRFWADRAIDFKPSVARRAVRRHARKPSPLRHAEIAQLDTFALGPLIAAMEPVETTDDTARARRMTELASHVSGRTALIDQNASIQSARTVVEGWQKWWARHHADYETLDGARRIVAMTTETRYGKWATEALENEFGSTADGASVAEVALRRAPVTIWLLLAGMLGGYLVGIAIGMGAASTAHRGADVGIAFAAVTLLALPVVVVASVVAATGGSGSTSRVGPALVMVLVAAALVSRHQRATARSALDQEFVRTDRALGAGPWRVAFRAFRPSSAAVVSLVSVDLPALLTAAFVVERVFGLEGIGGATVAAVTQGDVAWLMALSLVTAVILASLQIATDSVLGFLDPRIHVARARQRGGLE